MELEQHWTAADLRSAYNAGQRIFRYVDFESVVDGERLDAGTELQDLFLVGAVFEECWFHSTSFLRVDLTNAQFLNCNMKCTRFEGCNLTNSHWSECAVCAIAFLDTAVEGLEATILDAYGVQIGGAEAFVEYAAVNAQHLRPPGAA